MYSMPYTFLYAVYTIHVKKIKINAQLLDYSIKAFRIVDCFIRVYL